MNATAIKFDPYALIQPKRLEDVIALANEAITEIRQIREFFTEMLVEADEPIES